MPVGILTFHNNENRGAILQSYALSRILQNKLNISAEIVNYRTKSKEWERKRRLLITRRPRNIPRRFRDKKIVEKFLRTELSMSSNSITTNNHKRAVDWLTKQDYSAYVTGSDEIWKIVDNNENVFRSLLVPSRPFPNLYVLDPSISKVTFSYAASANKTTLDTLSESTISTLTHHLKAYDHLSVRDRHTKNLIQNLGIDNVMRVPDPTIMVDLPTKSVRELLKQKGVDIQNPVLGFHAPDKPVFGEICDLYRKQGYQIVSLRSSRFADIELEGLLDPFEYYSVHDYFDMLITSSLHSTIFSLKHGVPFATIDTSNVYENIESKTYSLLTDFDLLDRHIDAVDGDASKFYENRDTLEQHPDAEHIQSRIDTLQDQGYAFLEQVKDDL